MSNRIAGVEEVPELAAVPRLAHVPPALRRLIYQEGYVPAAEADRLLLAECVYPPADGVPVGAASAFAASTDFDDGPAPQETSFELDPQGEADDDHLQVLLTRTPLLRVGVPRVGLLISSGNPVQRDLVAHRMQQRLRSLLLLDGGVIQRCLPAAGGSVALITAPWSLRSAVRRAASCLMHVDPLLSSWDAQVSGRQRLEHDAAALSSLMRQAGGLDRHVAGDRHMVWRFSCLTVRDCVLPGRGVLWAVYLDDAAVEMNRMRLQLVQQALERVHHLGEAPLRWVSTAAATIRAEVAAKSTVASQGAGTGLEIDGGRHFQEVESRSHALPPWGLRLILRAAWNGPKTRRAVACVLAEVLGVTADRVDAGLGEDAIHAFGAEDAGVDGAATGSLEPLAASTSARSSK